jgi:NADP-dependent 3-hydroxy acid dehydrogenase YdfG
MNVSSVAGHKVGPAGAVCSATKTAVRVLSEGLRQEVKTWNIRTTIISPREDVDINEILARPTRQAL